MSSAEFTVEGDPFANLGYDALPGVVLDLQVVDIGTDVRKVKFTVESAPADSPALVFNPASGEPATLGGIVQVTMPAAGVHTYILQCQLNDGVDAAAATIAAWTKRRAIAIRAGSGVRKMAPGERTEYAAPDGWVEAFNGMVEATGGEVIPAQAVAGGAAATIVHTYTPAANGQFHISAIANCVDAGGDVNFYHVGGTYKRVGGVVSAVVASDRYVEHPDDPTWVLDWSTDGTDIMLKLTPDAVNETVISGFVNVLVW